MTVGCVKSLWSNPGISGLLIRSRRHDISTYLTYYWFAKLVGIHVTLVEWVMEPGSVKDYNDYVWKEKYGLISLYKL